MESRLCRNHPDRPATGICVLCRSPICPECTTKLQGVNHCTSCLHVKAGRATVRRTRSSGLKIGAGIAVSAGVYWLFFWGLGWALMHF